MNAERLNPYSSFKFLIYLLPGISPVAAVSELTTLNGSVEFTNYHDEGDSPVSVGAAHSKYNPITMNFGITVDPTFHDWAKSSRHQNSDAPSTSLRRIRNCLRIDVLDEAAHHVIRYKVHGAWISKYEYFLDFDANTNAVAIQHITLEHEGLERDLTP